MHFNGLGDKELSFAMLGMVEGNGHPYSWSAIFNGYDPDAMAVCPYPVIPVYLGQQPKEALGIPRARVTHIWTDDPQDAPKVAKASLIPNVVERPEDVIDHVDAVIIATDIGSEHVERCHPFVEAKLPIFVDKPLVDNVNDLRIFQQWILDGHPILSGSALTYSREFQPYHGSTPELGELRFISITTPKSWERYGIHALSAIYPILGPGFLSAQNTGTKDHAVVHFEHTMGAEVIVAAINDMYGGFGCLQLCGTKGNASTVFQDTFYAFKAQLVDFVKYLRTGIPPFPFSETEELMKMVIAGLWSRDQGGRKIALSDVQ
ncbi:MAG TPA: Gfo/Idh/MocA family oxidoreductase [Candidatus Hydrogenedentes bacterium]|nr:Gfo/Idh/MocA family oxidoreductase [Candidatus Hydrogenedentota bacterium]